MKRQAAVHPALRAVPPVELLDMDTPGCRQSARPVLYLHGHRDSKDQLRPLGAALSGQTREGYYVSLRGHGQSPAPPWGYSAWDHAADIQRLADVLPNELNIVGYSFGGLVAVAAGVVLGPRRVRSVIVIDQSFERRPELVEFDAYAELRFLKWEFSYDHLIGVLLSQKIAVQIVLGTRSHVVPIAERSRLMSRKHKLFRCDILDADHRELLSDPASLAAIIDAFLTTIPASSAARPT